MTENAFQTLSEGMAQAAETGGKSTVLVNARRRMPASGIAFAADLILTADHVVEREEDITVILPDGRELPASLAGRDPGSDLAVLRLIEAALTPAERATARVGQIALALGRPSTQGIEASLGVVSAIGGPVRTGRGGLLDGYIRSDATPYPGFSGGPLVDGLGRVLGLNTSGLAHMPLTIPAALVWQTGATLAQHGKIKRGFLGVRSQAVELPAAAQQTLGRSQTTGLLIANVEADSPAAQGGLMVGDILIGIGGKPVEDHDTLFAALAGDVVGKPTPLEILRGGARQILTVIIGER